jgi:xanthosine utilization system XapX-like protein
MTSKGTIVMWFIASGALLLANIWWVLDLREYFGASKVSFIVVGVLGILCGYAFFKTGWQLILGPRWRLRS